MIKIKSNAMFAIASLSLVLSGCSTQFGEISGRWGACSRVSVNVTKPDGSASSQLRAAGIEDITSSRQVNASADPVVFFSATDRRTWSDDGDAPCDPSTSAAAFAQAQDGVFYARLSEVERALATQAPVTARRLPFETLTGQDIHPHGIVLVKHGQSGGARLLVVNHPTRCVAGRNHRATSILAADFQFTPDGDVQASSVSVRELVPSSVDPARFCSANDIAALDPDRFIVTHDAGECPPPKGLFDRALFPEPHYLMALDMKHGPQGRRVGPGFVQANGIAANAAKGLIYVADTRAENVRVFHADKLMAGAANAELAPIRSPSGLDNLEWGDDGMLYAAAHPNVVRFVLHAWWPGLFPTSASALASSTPRGNPDGNIQLEFWDDGTDFSAASVALKLKQRLIAGAVFEEGIYVCRATGPTSH